MLKKVKEGCSFRASCVSSNFLLCKCFDFQGDVVWGGLEENKVLEKELKEKRLKVKRPGKPESVVYFQLIVLLQS